MWEYNTVDELYHHGVKGMKWGVRHEQETGGLSNRQAKKQLKREYKDMRRESRRLSAEAAARYDNSKAGLQLERDRASLEDSRRFNQAMQDAYYRGGAGAKIASAAGTYANAGRTRDLQNKVDAGDARRAEAIGKSVTKKMTEKYGAEKVSAFSAHEQARGKKIAAAILVGTAAAAVGTTVAVSRI